MQAQASSNLVLQLRVALATSDLRTYKWKGGEYPLNPFAEELKDLPVPLIQSILTYVKKHPPEAEMDNGAGEKKGGGKEGREGGEGGKETEAVKIDNSALLEQNLRRELERLSQGQLVKSAIKRRTQKLNARELALYGATKQAHKIPVATRQKMQQRIPTGEVYFVVDTSGSVSTFGNMISSMLASASTSKQIHVWTGSEARPTHKLENGLSTSENGYGRTLVDCLAAWLKSQKVPKGSVLVFWGDQQDSSYSAVHMRPVIEGYTAYWLSPIDRLGNDTNGVEAQKAGFTMFYDITSTKKFMDALKKVRV